MNPEAWAMESCNIRAKAQEQAEIAELTAQFLANGGKIKRYTPDSRAVVDDTKKKEKQKIARAKSSATAKATMTPKQRRFYDSIRRIELGGKFSIRELAESMRDTSYSEAKDMCKSLQAKYLITLDGDNGELL